MAQETEKQQGNQTLNRGIQPNQGNQGRPPERSQEKREQEKREQDQGNPQRKEQEQTKK